MKREAVDLGRFIPIARKVVFRCCRCGMKHTHVYRVRKGGGLDLKVLP
jgi:hypothetical protein